MSGPHKVIFDSDVGVDDAMALILLARSVEIDLLGVTTGFGNGKIDVTTRNTLYLKDYLGFQAPVAKGAAKPAYAPAPPPAKIHGNNALGDMDIPELLSEVDPRSAAQLIVDLVREHPGEVTIIMVARATNVALALTIEPDLPKMVRQIIIMGGAFTYNYGGKRSGQNLFTVAEANINGDPHAADLVINAGWPVTIIPLDVTIQTVMDKAYLAALPGKDGELIREMTRRTYVNAEGATPVHDSSAVFYLLRPDAYSTIEGKVRVITDGIGAGQTMIGPPSTENSAYANSRLNKVAVGVDANVVLAIYREALATDST